MLVFLSGILFSSASRLYWCVFKRLWPSLAVFSVFTRTRRRHRVKKYCTPPM